MFAEFLSVVNVNVNARIETYPDGRKIIAIASKPIFRPSGWEKRSRYPDVAKCNFEDYDPFLDDWRASAPWPEGQKAADAADKLARRNLARSRRRAAASVRRYALSNEFRYFVTLTLDGAKIDRYDLDGLVKKMRAWLSNAVSRQGLQYVLVPELHKDGAVHLHGFFNDALPVVDSGTVIPPSGGKPRKPRSGVQRAEWLDGGGHIVYNLPAWSLGYSTAIELYGQRTKSASYCCKYVAKSEAKLGGRWYYSSNNLLTPKVQYLDLTTDFSDPDCTYSYQIDEIDTMVKVYVLEPES